LEPEVLEAICATVSKELGQHVEVANVNAPGQVVLSGARIALDSAIELARGQGAQRAIPLKVSGPFHSVYMQPAADAFRNFCADAAIAAPRIPVVLNPTAQAEMAPDALRAELSQQITQPVRWVDSLHRMWGLGCRRFVEVGPGKVLTGMVRRTLPEAETRTVGTPAEAAALAAEIRV
jgi:[acyl-carrier-protein] S-malonyltransferase